MPGPYSLRLDNDSKGFDYPTGNPSNPTGHLDPGETSPEMNACQFIQLVNTAVAANPGRGGVRGVNMTALREECAAIPVNVTPSESPVNPPVESNPAIVGGDSPNLQGLQDPPVVGNGNENNPDNADNPPPGEEPTRPPANEEDPFNNGEQPQEQVNAGDPVDLFNGAFYLEETDLTVPNTIVSLRFTRFYRSGRPYFGPFGWNWDHNFNIYLRELSNGNVALWRQLNESTFTFNGAGYDPPRGVFELLEKLPGPGLAFEIKGKGGVVMHFEHPAGWSDAERIPIVWLKDQHGNSLHFSYAADNKLAEVKDDDDRFFQFTYDQCELLVAVEDQAGRKYTYEHDEQTRQLVCATSPPITGYPTGISRIYHYEQPWSPPELRHNILRVEDAEGNVYLENTYEQDPASWSFARVVEQLYGGFLYQFRYTQLQWVPANAIYVNIPAVRVEVMNPDYGLETYSFNYRGDLLDRRYRLNKDKSFRVVAWQYEFDEQGNLAKTTRPDGSEEINIFDFAHPDPRMRGNHLKKELTAASGFPAPSRIVWTGTYEPVTQQLIEEKNESGHTTTYKYDFQITPGAPNNTGKLMKVLQPDATLPDGTTQTAETNYEYNNKGQITAVILEDGTRNETTYGNAGNNQSRIIKEIFDVGGLDIEHHTSYDIFGYANEVKDGNGHSTQTIFNTLGLPEKRLMPAINGAIAEHTYHYNSDKRLISKMRPKGSLSDPTVIGNHIEDIFQYDVLGNIVTSGISTNTSLPREFRFCNNYRGQPVQVIHPDKSKINYAFDERGLVFREEITGTDGAKMTSGKVYDRAGRLVQETDTTGLVTKYFYDGFSRLSNVELPNGSEVVYSWLSDDLLASQQIIGDPGTGPKRELSFISFTYDERNRRVSRTSKVFTNNPAIAKLLTTQVFFDELNRNVKEIDHNGAISIAEYDGLGRRTLSRDATGNEVRNSYDNNGNLILIENRHLEPDGSTSILSKQMEYDARNRRVALIEPDGTKFESVYDDRDLLVKDVDYLGVSREIQYNANDKKVKEILDPSGLHIEHQWTLDEMLRVTSYIDPLGETSQYHFDSLGRNSKIEYPNGYIDIRTYDSQNRLSKETLTSGAVFEYTYDTANRISKIVNTTVPSLRQVATRRFEYDGLDRLLKCTSGTEEILRTYDSLGRLLSESSFGNSISCIYDDLGRVVEKLWPDGRIEQLGHDANGILTQINLKASGSLGTGSGTIANFNPSGPNTIGEATFSGGIVVRNAFDDRKRLTDSIVSSPTGLNERIKYRYNKANSKRVEALLGQNPKISCFEFDSQYRLLHSRDGFNVVIPDAITQADHANAISVVQAAALGATHEEIFTYNSADARTSYLETGNPNKNYVYGPGHTIQNDGANGYNHFTDGSLQSDGVFTFVADALGRIVEVKSGPAVITKITYDALGRPSKLKETGKPEKSFNYFGGFIEQENENGVLSKQITLHPVTGIPIAYHTAGATLYPIFDGRFNLVAMVDSNGNFTRSYRYKAFGEPQAFDSTGAPEVISNLDVAPVFGGQRFLASSGLYLSKRRLMNPVNGAYLSADPKGYSDAASLYVYAAQDPVNNIDPNGEVIPFIVAAFVIGGALGGAGYSAYDAYHNPDRYEGWRGSLRIFGNVFGGAAIGGIAILGGEVVLAAGGTGIFATGTGTAAATTLTATQSFVLYGTASATTGAIGRAGFNSLFPEYVDPVSAGTIATDFVAGGAFAVAAPLIRDAAAPLVRPIISGGREMFTRAVGGNWRAFGTTAKLLWKGYSRNSRLEYGFSRLFWNNRSFSSVSNQYWSQTVGRADGKALHHIFFQNQSTWIPQGLRNAGFNLLEIPASLNTWMGGRLWRELAFRGGVTSLLAGTGLGSYGITSSLLDNTEGSEQANVNNDSDNIHPNIKPESTK